MTLISIMIRLRFLLKEFIASYLSLDLFYQRIYVSTQTLSKLTGKLIPTNFIIGKIVQLKTRALYKVIEKRLSWDKKFNIGNYNDTVEEILYWKFNIRNLYSKVFREYRIPSLLAYQMQVITD